ncbi:hypothetical protein [Clostridium oryzae]|uniref:Uncharacterized protein n=1 Tax=Clostridium oryzae TaxID=1450648 RepID=A0A1V4ID33_9CLOT|nr:hypothetical protein [Clostridium oryzae]OPJ57912.1 hypothetical protein CLORY_38750 [Clostridium oryzae]
MNNNLEAKTTLSKTSITAKPDNYISSNEPSTQLYTIPVFLSYSRPYMPIQQLLLDKIIEQIQENLLFPRTLGRNASDQYTETNLVSFRRMILSSYGMISVAFHKVFVKEAILNPDAKNSKILTNFWLSSPYLQIEPAMAFQHGLPQLLLLETDEEHGSICSPSSNILGGVYEANSVPYSILKFSLTDDTSVKNFLINAVWRENFAYWVGQVRNAYKMNTEPKFKYDC